MVAGAHGTNIRGGRERAGKIFKFFRFFERERQRNRARERERDTGLQKRLRKLRLLF